MGFIEDLKRRTAEDSAAAALRQQVLDEQKKQRLEQEERDNMERIERINRERQQSHAYMDKSAFPSLVRDLSALVKNMTVKIPEFRSYDGRWESADSTAQITLIWGREMETDRRGSYISTKSKNINITYHPDGIIKVKGRHSYDLYFSQWSTDVDLQEKVLEDVFNNPEIKSEPRKDPSGPQYTIDMGR